MGAESTTQNRIPVQHVETPGQCRRQTSTISDHCPHKQNTFSTPIHCRRQRFLALQGTRWCQHLWAVCSTAWRLLATKFDGRRCSVAVVLIETSEPDPFLDIFQTEMDTHFRQNINASRNGSDRLSCLERELCPHRINDLQTWWRARYERWCK